MLSIIHDPQTQGRPVPTIPTRVSLPRETASELFGGWGVRFHSL